jgi:hypothetical protein
MQKAEPKHIDVHQYFNSLKRLIKPKLYPKIQYIDVIINDFFPTEVHIHYQDKDLEDPFSRKGARIPHHLYHFDKEVEIIFKTFTLDSTFDPAIPHAIRKDCFKGGYSIFEVKTIDI